MAPQHPFGSSLSSSLITAAVIAAGAVAGALARYAITGPILGKLATPSGGTGDPVVRFPWGVLAVNLTGCFLVGLVAAAFLGRADDDRLRLLLVTGFLGSFTTFSALGLDTFELLRADAPQLALANAVGSIVLGSGLAALGWSIGQAM